MGLTGVLETLPPFVQQEKSSAIATRNSLEGSTCRGEFPAPALVGSHRTLQSAAAGISGERKMVSVHFSREKKKGVGSFIQRENHWKTVRVLYHEASTRSIR